MFRHAAPVALLVLTSLVAPAAAATYHGRSVDGPRYHGSVMNQDYGAYDGVEVKFQGDHAFVYFPAGGRLVLILDDEAIADPHSIVAHDPRRGISWEIDVQDMVGR